jgi:hypothetical protein
MWSNLHEVVMWFFFFTLSPRLESARPFSPMTLTLPWNWWGWAASFVEICLQCIFDSCWFCLSWLWNFNATWVWTPASQLMDAFNLYFSNFLYYSFRPSKTSETSLVFCRPFTVTVSFLVPVVEIRLDQVSLCKLGKAHWAAPRSRTCCPGCTQWGREDREARFS